MVDQKMSAVVDVHTHVYLPRYMEYLRRRTQVPRVVPSNDSERLIILPGEDLDGSTQGGRPIGPEYYDPLIKLKFMDVCIRN
jgi:aminocarboxymuconate-semialdehyde decarboxylase